VSQNTRAEAQRQKTMLRTLKAGDRVKATSRAPYARQGGLGTVLDPEPFQPDGVRRVRVQWDNHGPVSVLPSSIEVAD
jgi:hypothetical protein